MVKTGDPMLEVFRGRDDSAVRETYMAEVEKEAAEREGGKKNRNRRNGRRAARPGT